MKTILHLCADIGSDSYPYSIDPNYEVILIGKEIGVENYHPDRPIHGVIANPVCTEFSIATGFHRDIKPDTTLVSNCQRIIAEAEPKWWVIENPASGRMKDFLGEPDFTYEPWHFGSPWTKRTALWGNFVKPEPFYTKWDDVPKNGYLYVRPGRPKTSMAFLHKNAIHHIPEFAPFVDRVVDDNGFRSLCSQGFANEFKRVNP